MIISGPSRLTLRRCNNGLVQFTSVVLLTTLLTVLGGFGRNSDVDVAQASQRAPLVTTVHIPARAWRGGVVTASLVPSVETERRLPRKPERQLPGRALVADSGAVELRLNPSDVPGAFVEPGGLVTVNVHFESSAHRLVGDHMLTLRMVNWEGKPVWLDPRETVRDLQRRPGIRMPKLTGTEVPGHLRANGRITARSLAKSVPAARMNIVRAPRGMRLGEARGLRLTSSSSDPIGGVGYTACKWLNKRTKRWATIGTSYPLSRSKSWLTHSNSSSSTFGTAASFDKGVSFSAAGSRTTQDDWGQNFAKRSVNRSFRVRVRYRMMRCAYYYAGKFRYEKSRRWVARNQTGGTDTYRLSKKPNFKRCEPIAAGDWWRGRVKGKDYTLSYGVKFKGMIGVDLSSRRSYTNGAKLYYDHPRKRRVCGNNADPSRAGKVRERRKG